MTNQDFERIIIRPLDMDQYNEILKAGAALKIYLSGYVRPVNGMLEVLVTDGRRRVWIEGDDGEQILVGGPCKKD